MTDFFRLMGLGDCNAVIAWLKNSRIREYDKYPNRVDIDVGFYHSTEREEDSGSESYSSSIYVWTDRNKRMSFHFVDGKLDHILAPTNTMVRL